MDDSISAVAPAGGPAYSDRAYIADLEYEINRRAMLDRWISVAERLPGPGVNVLFGYRNKYDKWRTLRGHHSPLHTVDASMWEDGADETEDGAFEPEGWWEEPVESETLNYVSDAVSHWMPLPEPPDARARDRYPQGGDTVPGGSVASAIEPGRGSDAPKDG